MSLLWGVEFKREIINKIKHKPSWIFFDLDGTLADSLPVMYQVYQDFLADYGVTGSKAEFDELNGPSLKEVVAILKARYFLKGSSEELLSQYQAKIGSLYSQFIKPVEGAAELLNYLCESGYQLMLVTSTTQNVAKTFIHKQGWSDYFKDFVFGDSVLVSKPHPEIYQIALARAKVDSSSVVVVEDSVNGILSACAAGLTVIGLTSNNNHQSLINAGSSAVIDKLKDLENLLSD